MTFFVCTDATGYPVVTTEPSEIGDIVQMFETRGPADDLVAEIRAGRAANDPKSVAMPALRRALFLSAQHCQGGHSHAGAVGAEVLGVPFPITMADLVAKVRAEGENPAEFYPWLAKAVRIPVGPRRGQHPYFTEAELANASRPAEEPAHA
ncbi:hypothetical protein [Phenylobacterium ferrooxidans]|uniref:Uncharacterized protein n=1 Tax=Phenylobacterium ferrooxidans TaxID=2982689 RepID=A0ABW6CN33_9CAUL